MTEPGGASEVGAIIGYLRLNRDDWVRGVHETEGDSERLGRLSPNIRIQTNAASVIAALNGVAAAENRVKDAQERVTVSQTRLGEVRKRYAADSSQVQRAEAAVAKAVRDHEQAERGLTDTVRSAEVAQQKLAAARRKAADDEARIGDEAKKAEPPVASLMSALTAIAPAAVPIAGAAGIAGAALVWMGVQGTLAIKGIQAAMKSSTADGLQFAAGVATIKSDVQQLEATAAHGVLAGFQDSVTKLHADVPSLNADLAQSSKILGDIGGHLVTAAIGGVHSFAPALMTAQTAVDHLAARFETWATGPGGEAFAQALSRDFTAVEPVIEHVTETLGRLIAGSNAPGLGVLTVIDDISSALNSLDKIAPGATTALVTGLIAMKAAGVVSALFGRLALSVEGAAAAESASVAPASASAAAQRRLAGATNAAAAANVRAAETSVGARGRLSAGIGFLGTAAAAWIAVALATNSAAKATDDWKTSSDGTKRFAGQLTGALGDLSTFKFSKFGSDVGGSNRESQEAEARFTAQLQNSLFQQGMHLHEVQYLTLKRDGNDLVYSGQGSISKALAATASATMSVAQSQTVAAQIQASYSKYTDQTTHALDRQAAALSRAGSSGEAVSQLGGAYQSATAGIQKQIDSTEKFLKLGGQTVETYHGMKIGANTYQAALQQTGGDVDKATGLIHAMVDGLTQQRAALTLTAGQQQRLGGYVSDLSTKFGLTGQQIDTYTQALGINLDTVSKYPSGVRDAEAAVSSFIRVLNTGNTAVMGLVAADATFQQSGQTVADRANLIGATLKAANGDALDFAASMAGSTDAVSALTDAFKSQSDQLAQQSAAQQSAANTVTTAHRGVETSAARVTAAEARLAQVRANSKSTTAQIKAAEAAVTAAQNASANSAQRLGQAQTAAGKAGALAYADTERAAIKFTGSGKHLTASIDTTAKGAGALILQLQGIQDAAVKAAAATYQHEKSLGKASAADDAFNVYLAQTQGVLVSHAKQMHLTKGEAKALADQYFAIKNSGDLKKTVEMEGSSQVVKVLDRIGQLLANLTGQQWTIPVHVVTRGKLPHEAAFDKTTGQVVGPGYATGGDITGNGPRGVDSVPLIGAPGEWMATTRGADMLRSIFGRAGLAQINLGRTPGMTMPASGGAAAQSPGHTLVDKRVENQHLHVHFPRPGSIDHALPVLMLMADNPQGGL